MFPSEGWLLDLRIAKVATSEHIWSQIALERKVEDRDSYGLFTEKGVMMANNIPAVQFKIKNKVSNLTIHVRAASFRYAGHVDDQTSSQKGRQGTG